jgi:acyl-CoA thioesterase
MSREIAQKIAEKFNSRRTLDKLLGIEFVSIDTGAAVMKLKLTEDMVNVYGSAHGGTIFALADSVFAYACNSRNIISVAAGCSIEYLAPAFPGDTLTASGKIQGGPGR